MYCNELVYVTYKDKIGHYLFKEIPMNFKNKDGKFHSYWIDLFKKLNMEIPQTKMGTNPHIMMKDNELLELVCEIKCN